MRDEHHVPRFRMTLCYINMTRRGRNNGQALRKHHKLFHHNFIFLNSTILFSPFCHLIAVHPSLSLSPHYCFLSSPLSVSCREALLHLLLSFHHLSAAISHHHLNLLLSQLILCFTHFIHLTFGQSLVFLLL